MTVDDAITPSRRGCHSISPWLSLHLAVAVTPSRQAVTPSRQAVTPSRQAVTPSRQAVTPSRQAVTPSRQAVTPSRQAVTPSRQADEAGSQQQPPLHLATADGGAGPDAAEGAERRESPYYYWIEAQAIFVANTRAAESRASHLHYSITPRGKQPVATQPEPS
ncbi:autotransporter outer membrane beta-barrel domain-containing protein [Venturia nashicola]|uniref:Autotransporter outer membrane beta-barrel domain-containing protein n=1 Tax=Venturia nashicola TaxID=86259 RepID=A0A4Z1P565_9PEZI|nr:autotransporter outer membrane beta-barrel domain-containing protein [Venturia nashicola]